MKLEHISTSYQHLPFGVFPGGGGAGRPNKCVFILGEMVAKGGSKEKHKKGNKQADKNLLMKTIQMESLLCKIMNITYLAHLEFCSLL